MKKILSILISTVLVIGVFSGCGTKDSAYSKEEKQMIKEANQMISNEYAVDIEEDDFSYSVGKQISEKEFVPLDSEQKQEAAYENILRFPEWKNRIGNSYFQCNVLTHREYLNLVFLFPCWFPLIEYLVFGSWQ